MDTLADTAQALRSRLRPGELEALSAIALGAIAATDTHRAASIGLLRVLAADNDARAQAGSAPSSWSYDRGRFAGTSTPATPAPDPTFDRLAAEVAAVDADEARWAASDLAVFGIDTAPAGAAAHLTADEARWAASDLAVFGIDTR